MRKYISRIFCGHKKRELVDQTFTDDAEEFVCVEAWMCTECGDIDQRISGGLIARQKLELRTQNNQSTGKMSNYGK